jgi:hypothetical protein
MICHCLDKDTVVAIMAIILGLGLLVFLLLKMP